ncbi:unnamed protein product [Anisakis simplex]|uniref:F-box domain-containing protein n=1 Tax=Anisakis simplex TaxID=6269 RepID=A0A0M3KFR8_ANISI|nr:unnamed protein product [Anisakis simplex]
MTIFRAKWLFGHFNQLDDYPLRERKYLKTRWYYGRRHPRPAPILQQNVAQITEKVVPDVVLLNVFKYLHPMDLINGASRVSRRWNQLSRSPSLYRYVRVLVNQQSAQSGSAMEFLQRVGEFMFDVQINVEYLTC